MAIWQAVLGISPIGIDDNFFELGGHSLLALRLLAQIQQYWGWRLPLAALFAAATPAQLALQLQKEEVVDTESSLVPVQLLGGQPPFFCVHGGAGTVLHYSALARHLGADRPFYALQAVGLDGRTPPLTTVEAMAAHYVAAIQSVQPQGPYWIGGHSLGGQIAYAMAQLLCRAGHEVALVVVVDTFAPGGKAKRETLWDDTEGIVEMVQVIEQFLGVSLRLTYADLASMALEEQLLHVQVQLQKEGLLPVGFGSERLRGFYQVFKANNQADYLPGAVIPVPIALLRGSDSTDRGVRAELRADPTWGWHAFAEGAVDLQIVPGDHSGMMQEPHVRILAQRVNECLARRGWPG